MCNTKTADIPDVTPKELTQKAHLGDPQFDREAAFDHFFCVLSVEVIAVQAQLEERSEDSQRFRALRQRALTLQLLLRSLDEINEIAAEHDCLEPEFRGQVPGD